MKNSLDIVETGEPIPKIAEGKVVVEHTQLEKMISEFYQTENLTVDELVNEMIEHSENKNEMAANIYSLLEFLNKTI